MFVLKRAISCLVVALPIIISVSAFPKSPDTDIKVVSSPGHGTVDSTACDEDCRRNKRRRKWKETQRYMNAMRNGEMTEKEHNKHVMLDRLMVGEYSCIMYILLMGVDLTCTKNQFLF